MIQYQQERFCNVWPEVQELLHRHWDEVACKDICGALNINEKVYRLLEESGSLHLTTARVYDAAAMAFANPKTCEASGGAARLDEQGRAVSKGLSQARGSSRRKRDISPAASGGKGLPPARGTIIGYALYILAANTHYQHKYAAEADAFFLAPEYRKGRTGILLLKAAEAGLLQRGVNMFVQKVKVEHDCGSIFRRMGYKHVENVWMKGGA